MAKKPDGRTFNVSVIGLSGTEKDKGQYGVGKSCLCNRFIHQVADKYHHEHISVLSQSDFGGRVINNDHFLYWGEVTKTDEGNNFTFQVIEQTEFIDDVQFTPFKTGRTDPYHKRSVQTKVSSAEKLMYICKEQLGMETDSAFEQKVMGDGKLSIDGFLCCFDVSNVTDRSLEKQAEVCALLLTNALKTKKPVVLVTTKNDTNDINHMKEVEKILMRKEFKSTTIPVVETSAHKNVNVETAFILLAHMMDKSKRGVKPTPFSEAMKARNEILEVAKEAFKNLLRIKITDFKTHWTSAKKKLEKESDYQHFVDLFGTDDARKAVKQHTKQLREELIKCKQSLFLNRLPDVLNHFLPDLSTIGEKQSWTACQVQMLQDKDFDEFFVKVCEDGDSWKYTDFVDNIQENRLPMDILGTEEADAIFRTHINALQAAKRKEELKNEFRGLLERHIQVPGSTLSDNYTLFVGKDCYNKLQEDERQHVYDEYQNQLKKRLRKSFQELLWERHFVFRNLNLNQNLTEVDLNVIYNSLNDDQRFRVFHKLEDDRKVMLLNHVVFLSKPSIERCHFHFAALEEPQCNCTECQVSGILRSERLVPNGRSMPPPPYSCTGPVVRNLNLVLLGMDGLATELHREIRACCIDDEFHVGRTVYRMDYRPIEEDVSKPGNSIFVSNFKPNGCICVYDSSETLEFIRTSILKTLETYGDAHLPLVVMLAYEPYTVKERNYLRENGQLLASSLRCKYIDVPHEDLAEKLKFYPEQIEQALDCFLPDNSNSIKEDTEPDLRLLMCMMCADPFPMEIPLRPFLSDMSFTVISDPDNGMGETQQEEENVFTVDMVLGGAKQKVEVTVTSYHGAHLLCQKGYIYHGYILAYCPKRKASLASLKAFAETRSNGSMMIIAVPEGSTPTYSLNEHSQGLKEGKDVAKHYGARFIQASTKANWAKQEYEKFLLDVWEHREEVDDELDLEHSPPPAYDPNYQRPPAPLPNQLSSPYLAGTNKSASSNSQSTEDSEPLYDQPIVFQQAPSESDRAYSPSPPPLPSSSPPPNPSDTIPYRNDHELVKPSMLKEKRNQYAGITREQYRKSFPAVDTQTYKIRSTMSQSMTEHLDTRAATTPPGYLFRKSRSMKLAVKDDGEAWAINEPHRQSKSSTLPTSGQRGSRLNESPYADPQRLVEEEDKVWQTKPKTNTFFEQYAIPHRPHSGEGRPGGVHAPLALPEKIEISEQYGTVKDAITNDNHYARVDDELPFGKIRIKSTSRKEEKGCNSEESEFSSLEREKTIDLYSKVNRKPTPHKKKHKSKRSIDRSIIIGEPQPIIEPEKVSQTGSCAGVKARSNSPSEDSAGTGDEQSLISERRRSLKKKKAGGSSVNLSDSDLISSPHDGSIHKLDDEDSRSTDQLIHKVGSEEVDLNDLNESGNWGTWFKKKTGKDPRGVIEKNRKEEERRRQRETEKKQKEQQKLQKKIRKKDNKATGQSESSLSLTDFSMSPNNPSVPHFIEKCVEYIEAEGLHAEGIYRIPGNKAQVDLLTNRYTEDSNIDISTLEIQVNAVATVLKSIFAELTDPLIPVEMYGELNTASAITDKRERVKALKGVLLRIKPLNFEVLKFLITHLNKVGKNSDQNSMDSKNLAICWWPTLFRMEFESFDEMTTLSRIPGEILQTLIEECTYFFHSGDEI